MSDNWPPCPKCGEPEGMRCGREMLCAGCWNAVEAVWQARMAIRQDPAQFDMDRLVRLLLTQHWMHECRIIPAYMPPYPGPNCPPKCVVEYTYDDGDTTYLRHSKGPLQGYCWDSYGDDLHTPELALVTISRSPAPTRVHAVVDTHGK